MSKALKLIGSLYMYHYIPVSKREINIRLPNINLCQGAYIIRDILLPYSTFVCLLVLCITKRAERAGGLQIRPQSGCSSHDRRLLRIVSVASTTLTKLNYQ